MEATPAPANVILLTIPEVAHELRCSVATVYREIAGGKLATRRIRGKTNVHRDDLAAYLEAARRELRPADDHAPEPMSRRRLSLKAAGLIDGDDFGYRPGRGAKKG